LGQGKRKLLFHFDYCIKLGKLFLSGKLSGKKQVTDLFETVTTLGLEAAGQVSYLITSVIKPAVDRDGITFCIFFVSHNITNIGKAHESACKIGISQTPLNIKLIVHRLVDIRALNGGLSQFLYYCHRFLFYVLTSLFIALFTLSNENWAMVSSNFFLIASLHRLPILPSCV